MGKQEPVISAQLHSLQHSPGGPGGHDGPKVTDWSGEGPGGAQRGPKVP